jgi:type I restriction enzyme S subunit
LLKKIKADTSTSLSVRRSKPLPEIKSEEIPFELPKGWEWVRLGEAGILERGKSKHRPRNDKKLFNNGKYPFIQTGDVSNAKKNQGLIKYPSVFYNEYGLLQSKLWKKGTLCITIAANIAETGFLDFEACFPDSIVGFTAVHETLLLNYVQYFIENARDDLERFAPSTAQKNINIVSVIS